MADNVGNSRGDRTEDDELASMLASIAISGGIDFRDQAATRGRVDEDEAGGKEGDTEHLAQERMRKLVGNMDAEQKSKASKEMKELLSSLAFTSIDFTSSADLGGGRGRGGGGGSGQVSSALASVLASKKGIDFSKLALLASTDQELLDNLMGSIMAEPENWGSQASAGHSADPAVATAATATAAGLGTDAQRLPAENGSAVDPARLWKKATDKSGRVYFYNRVTKRTVWSLPEDGIVVGENKRTYDGMETSRDDNNVNTRQEANATAGIRRKGSTPSAVELETGESRPTVARRRSSATPPPLSQRTGVSVHPTVASTAEAGGDDGGRPKRQVVLYNGVEVDPARLWQGTTDARGKTYYYNKVTRETVWKLPDDAILIPARKR